MTTKIFPQLIPDFLFQPIWESVRLIKYAKKRIPEYEFFSSYVKNKNAIEIGGPSRLFRTIFPLYQDVNSLDGVNFSTNTIWEGCIQSGKNYKYYGRKVGHQYISDAIDLKSIKSNTYDVLLSSNCLEHIANPLKAISEWRRIMRNNAAFVLVLPNKEGNFDHNRPVTTFQHILDDYINDTSEADLTHLEETLELHDLSMDPSAGSLENFKNRSLDNFNNRTLHHHVFDLSLIKEMLNYSGFKVIKMFATKKDFFALSLKNN